MPTQGPARARVGTKSFQRSFAHLCWLVGFIYLRCTDPMRVCAGSGGCWAGCVLGAGIAGQGVCWEQGLLGTSLCLSHS